MESKVKVLKAFHGDSILIQTFDLNGNPFIMLIDGGPSNAYDYCLRDELENIPRIDVLVLTHIDSDHIGGFIRFVNSLKFEKIEIGEFWINSPNLINVGSTSNKISFDEANNLERLLIGNGVRPNQIVKITNESKPNLPAGLDIIILSPREKELQQLFEQWTSIEQELIDLYSSREQISGTVKSQLDKGSLKELAQIPFKPLKKIEDDLINSSSIAFILESKDFCGAFLADSRSEIIEEVLLNYLSKKGLKKVEVDFVKISHHGSKNNTSLSLLELFNTKNYIISTNGGSGRSRHPHREVIGRILHHPSRDYSKKINIVFNYPISEIESKAGKFFAESETKEDNWNYFENIENILELCQGAC